MEKPKPGLSQKEYLKRYLMKDKDKKPKKKKSQSKISSSTHLKRSVIIDDDINISEIPRVVDEEITLDHLGDEAPQIVGIIDERPEEIKLAEKYGTGKWIPIEEDSAASGTANPSGDLWGVRARSDGPKKDPGGGDSDLSPPRARQNEDTFGKKGQSDKRRTEQSDSDTEVTRRSDKDRRDRKPHKSSRTKRSDDSGSDISLPRRRKENGDDSRKRYQSSHSTGRRAEGDRDSNRRYKRGSDSDMSPPRRRKGGNDSDVSPPRRRKGGNDSDLSPPRRRKGGRDADLSPPRRRKEGNGSDLSPPRRRKGGRDADLSPPVRRKGDDDSDQSPPRRTKRDNNSDLSPPRSRKGGRDADLSLQRRRKGDDDSDQSPPRRTKRDNNSDLSASRRRKGGRDPDLSPPRRRKGDDDSDLSPPRRRQRGNDSDLSPPRRRKTGDSPARKKGREDPDSLSRSRRESQGRPNEKQKSDKMHDGKKSGLQDAKSLKDELRMLKEKEDEVFRQMDPELLGRSTAAVVRDRKTGLKRDFEKERDIERQKAAKNAVRQKKYEKWGKGLKQIQDQQDKVAEIMHEMSKPLARYAGDDDLERALKAQEREGDPMLEYIRRHQRDAHTIDLTVGGSRKKYQGSFLPNRFNIPPGHRWDGVDRSNGYEQKWFEAKNAKKATAEEAWKWSSADM